jgi:polysaccharide deacetylase 2 family uncharacterized protein YibQ
MTAIAMEEPELGPSTRRFNWRLVVRWAIGLLLLIAVPSGYLMWRLSLLPSETKLALSWPDGIPSQSSVQTQATRAKTPRGLILAPDPRLVDLQPSGLLPKIADDGSRPFEVYARPVSPTPEAVGQTPRIAILLTEAGIGQLATVEAMVTLPPEISIALSPYGSDLDRQAADIRGEGHELMLDLSVRDPDLPSSLSASQTLSDALPLDENQRRLDWALGRFPGFFAVTGRLESRISGIGSVKLALDDVHLRGLGLLDLTTSGQVVALDAHLTPSAIDEALVRLEQKAHQEGTSIGVAQASPLAIDRLRNWNAGLAARGIRLVPVSALMQGVR